MVALKDRVPRFTPEEYFAWEEQQLCRHEYLDGIVNYEPGDSIDLQSVNLTFPIEQVYEDITFVVDNGDRSQSL